MQLVTGSIFASPRASPLACPRQRSSHFVFSFVCEPDAFLACIATVICSFALSGLFRGLKLSDELSLLLINLRLLLHITLAV